MFFKFLFFLVFFLVFHFTQPGFCQLFDLKSLAMNVADKTLQTHSADTTFPVEPINDPKLLDYINHVRSNLDPYAIHQNLPVLVLKTARIQGQSIPLKSFKPQDPPFWKEIDVTRGMLNMIANEAELACLIGHEIGHADHNDQFTTSAIEGVLTSAALIAANTAGVGDIAADINKNRQSLMAAAWSQSVEQSADEYGAVLAAKAGYDPYALCDLFDRLMVKVKATSLDQGIDLTSSHKSFDERSKHLREYLKENGYKPGNGFLKRKEYAEGIATIINIHTEEGITNDQRQDIVDLQKIDNELSQDQKNGKKLEPKQYVKIMKRFSQYAKKYHISRSQLEQIKNNNFSNPSNSITETTRSFMAATVDQDTPFDPNSPNGLGPAGQSFIQGLDLIAHVGLAIAAPEVMIPIMAYEAIAGQDFFTGQNLSTGQRALSALGAIIPGAAQEEEMAESLEQLATGDKNAVRAVETGVQDLKYVERSPTLNNIVENPDFQTSDFVVRDDGSIIPANGYRYIDSNNPNLSSYLNSGEIPASPKGTYVSFDKFDDMDVATSKLQTQGFNDARYRITFETQQTANSLKIPNGNWGQADWLEPITKDFPGYGEGGATQAITNSPIKINNIVDLKTGETIYGK